MKHKIDVLYSDNVVTWDELKLPMHEVSATGKWHDFNALVEDHAESESVGAVATFWTASALSRSPFLPSAVVDLFVEFFCIVAISPSALEGSCLGPFATL